MLEKILNYDNPVMSFLTFLGKIILLNFMWILFSIPVVTIGASTTALYKVMFSIIAKNDSFPFKTFVVTFKKEFKNSTKVWLAMVLGICVFSFDFYFGFKSTYSFSKFFLILGIVGVLLFSLITFLVFPYICKYNNNFKGYIGNTFKIVCCCPVRCLFILVLWGGCILLTICIPRIMIVAAIIWPMLGVSLLSYFTTHVMISVFKTITKKSNAMSD